MRESGLFAVNVLAEEQEDVSRRFAAPGRAKLEGFAFVEGKPGLPLVPGALAHVECRVRSFHDEGDHAVWVGEVRSLAAHPGRPLLLPRGRLPAARAGPAEWQARRRSVIKTNRIDETLPRRPLHQERRKEQKERPSFEDHGRERVDARDELDRGRAGAQGAPGRAVARRQHRGPRSAPAGGHRHRHRDRDGAPHGAEAEEAGPPRPHRSPDHVLRVGAREPSSPAR